MGGQKGGMTNEVSSFPEICKKSIQAQLTDIQKEIPKTLFKKQSITDFRKTSPRELERLGRLNTPLFKSGDSNHYNPIGWDDAL